MNYQDLCRVQSGYGEVVLLLGAVEVPGAFKDLSTTPCTAGCAASKGQPQIIEVLLINIDICTLANALLQKTFAPYENFLRSETQNDFLCS